MPVDIRLLKEKVLEEIMAAMDEADGKRLTGGGDQQDPDEDDTDAPTADGIVQPLDELPIAQKDSSGDLGVPPDDDDKKRLLKLAKKG